MKKKVAYTTPRQTIFLSVPRTYICGDDSLPFGGDDGPDVAETKQLDYDSEEPTSWGNLW